MIDLESVTRETLLAVLREHLQSTGDVALDCSPSPAILAEFSADQYADRPLEAVESPPATETSLYAFIPLRLAYEERPSLRLVEAALETSEYTDKVDNAPPKRKLLIMSRHISALLTGLVTAVDPVAGAALSKTRDFDKHADFYGRLFEVARRYKLLNPERMRSNYGKLVYFLQDLLLSGLIPSWEDVGTLPAVATVQGKCDDMLLGAETDLHGRSLLLTATAEIAAEGKPRYAVDREIKQKQLARKVLVDKFGKSVPAAVVEQVIYSISDVNTFFRYNREPVDKLIDYLHKYFGEDGGKGDLGIAEGEGGSRLTHSHKRQFAFVLQSLTLWREVLHEIFRLWSFAEADLLDVKNNPYELMETGQGWQRVQKAPRVLAAMNRIICRIQRQLQDKWIGSSIVHLGDKNVPNALLFIDKYMQVPRILTPLVLVLDRLQTSSFGSQQVIMEILRDFFRHAFDGSGADNFFEAGSCIDGRLTSAWNWCSQIEQKPYFPLFLLSGFSGFDGKEGW